jgi:hypothetical protein
MCSSSPDAATRDVGDKNVATYFSGDMNVDNVVSGHGRTRCADGFFLKTPRSAQHSRDLALWYSLCSTLRQPLAAFMTRKTVAWLLFVLALSPFTAPFATCDLATLFVQVAGIAATTADTPVVRGGPHDLSPIANDEVLAVSWFDSTPGRGKPLAIAPYSLPPPLATDGPSGASLWLLNPMRLLDGQPVAPTALRL